MKNTKPNGRFFLLPAGLLAAAAFLRWAVRGYAYWGYFLAFVAALLLLHRFLPAALWRVLLVLVAVGFAYFCVVEAIIIRDARTDKGPGRPYLIVLGAAVYGERPSLTLENRLIGALRYYEQYPDTRIIVSGGQGPGENITEAACMADWLRSHGVPEDAILLEPRATSTKENLQYSFALIRCRAKTMARMQGVEAAGVAAPWGYFFVMLNYFIREAFGMTHLWVLGW